MTNDTDLGPLPAPDMCHEKARDDRDEETSYSAEAMEAERQRCYALGVAAERDCRTCRNLSTKSGGCVSVLRCTNGSAYKRAGVIQYWETTPDDTGF